MSVCEVRFSAGNGPAIPNDVAEQIFVPFFSTKKEGSGIGLSLSRQIMKLSGGTITLLKSGTNGWPVTFLLDFQ
jgi:nitrogen-specific signal transduction histidine kinase